MKFFNKIIKILTVIALVFITNFATKANAQTANGTITVKNALKGKTYTIYKLFDATVGANGEISYRLPQGKSLDNNEWFKVDTAGNVLLKDGVTEETVKAALNTDPFKNWAKSFQSHTASQEATGTSLVFSNVPFGYYLVTSSLGTDVTVDSTKPNVVINDKNTIKPSIPETEDGGKTVVTGVGTTSRAITAGIGDKVDFQVKFTTVNYVTERDASGEPVTKQVISYKVVDTPTALNIDQNSVRVKVGSQVINSDQYTVTKNDAGVLTVVVKWRNDQKDTIYESPADLIVTYSARVTAAAADAPATNRADISYRLADKDGNEQPDTPDTPITPPVKPGEPSKPTPTPTITTYKFTLNKVNDQRQPLTGARFRLYSAATDGTEIAVRRLDNGEYIVVERDADGNIVQGQQAEDIVAGSNIVIKGLKGSTTYYLEETVAPDGYNRLTAREAVQIGTDNTAVANVINHAGTELPSTGGMGRTIFYVLGTGLLGAVVVVFISRMKMKTA